MSAHEEMDALPAVPTNLHLGPCFFRHVQQLIANHFAFVSQQTIRELFDMNDGEKREAAVELSVPHSEEEEAVNKQSTTILEQVGLVHCKHSIKTTILRTNTSYV